MLGELPSQPAFYFFFFKKRQFSLSYPSWPPNLSEIQADHEPSSLLPPPRKYWGCRPAHQSPELLPIKKKKKHTGSAQTEKPWVPNFDPTKLRCVSPARLFYFPSKKKGQKLCRGSRVGMSVAASVPAWWAVSMLG